MTGQNLARLGLPPLQPSRSTTSPARKEMNELVLRLVSVISKRISDLLVGVHHDSDGGAEGVGWKVLSELSAHLAALSVRGRHLTPDALVIDTSLRILSPVDESNALAMVGHGRTAVLASLNLDNYSVLLLRSLASLESEENTLRVKSNWLACCFCHFYFHSNTTDNYKITF